MKTVLKCLGALILLLSAVPGPVRAGQQVYLSLSPNGKFRVIVEQVIYRRVGDKVFFRYPIQVVNAKDPQNHHFEITEAGDTLVRETEKGTFKTNWNAAAGNWDAVRFDWSKDSQSFFFRLETVPDSWKTFYVDVEKGAKDITAELQVNLVQKSDLHNWDCGSPRVQVVKWVKPHLVYLNVTSVCGKNKGRENKRQFEMADSVLFDVMKGTVVADCMNCKEVKADQKFEEYYQKSLPTPTPTPEETPGVQ